jgi:hypothetical protein
MLRVPLKNVVGGGFFVEEKIGGGVLEMMSKRNGRYGGVCIKKIVG